MTLSDERRSERAHELVARLGPHLASRLALDLHGDPEPPDEATLRRWLVAVALHAPRCDDDRIAAAHRALEAQGLGLASIADGSPLDVERCLAEADHPKPDAAAALLSRLGVSVGALDAGLRGLLDEADSLEAIGGGLARLAPGFGRAGVTRFLQPLRDAWPICAELPLDPAAVAAGVHLDLLDDGIEPAFAAEALRRFAAGTDGVPSAIDLEAALTRLGRRACARGHASRCPVEAFCPLA